MSTNVDKLTRDDILATTKDLGIQREPFARCIDEHLHAKDVDADMALGEEVGVSGTPSFFVNGRLVDGGTVDHFVEVIDDELRSVSSGSSVHRRKTAKPDSTSGN